MTDKERILTAIIGATAYQTTPHRILCKDSVYWDFIGDSTGLKRGDIIMGMTNPSHKFGISFIEKCNSSSGSMTVREIGTDNLCDYSNELFLVLKNFSPMSKLCGVEYKIMIKIRRAMSDIYGFAFAGVEFTTNNLRITIRKKWTNNQMFVFDYGYDCAMSRITISALRDFLTDKSESVISSRDDNTYKHVHIENCRGDSEK